MANVRSFDGLFLLLEIRICPRTGNTNITLSILNLLAGEGATVFERKGEGMCS